MPKFVAYIMLTCYISSPCCMSREKVSISLDKDEKSLRTFNLQHMVKAMPLTSWHLTNFFSIRSVIRMSQLASGIFKEDVSVVFVHTTKFMICAFAQRKTSNGRLLFVLSPEKLCYFFLAFIFRFFRYCCI